VQAFDIAAVDYLVKPVSFERFVQAVQKLIQPGVREEEQNKQVPASCIFIKVDKRLVKVDYASIRYIEAMGDYLKVRTTDSTLISYMPIGKMESLLPSSRFIRIHRSTIVHLNFIEYIEGNVVVIGGEHLAIGLTYREELMKRLNG
jgi:DNA-binding LytR/AlgR family response regulator